MGGHVRIYQMPDGIILGFYREQGAVMMFAKVPGSEQVVFAYANPEEDYRYELVAATRSPKSVLGRVDAVLIRDNRTQAVKSTKAKFLGVGYEAGQNRYLINRPTHDVNEGK